MEPAAETGHSEGSKVVTIMGSFGGIGVAIFLLVVGVLLVSGILNFLLWILGAVCIVLGVIVGAMAIFGKKDRY